MEDRLSQNGVDQERADLELVLNQLMNGSMFEMLNAAAAIKVYGEAAVERLIPVLQNHNRETWWKAAVALGRWAPRQSRR